MNTKPVIKSKGITAQTPAQAPASSSMPTPSKETATPVAKEPLQKKVSKTPAPVTGATGPTPSVRQGRVPTRQEYVEPEDIEGIEDEEDYDEYGNPNEYDMEQMEAMREYENQRMAEVFTQVLATVFTYENITLPETILTLSQALETHNKTQEGILQALNKIADKLSK